MVSEKLSNAQLVTIAVTLLGGDYDYCDKEDIATQVNDIAPMRFTWLKYPERIDLAAVKTALRAAKKPINGELLIGNNKKGWMLSPSGINWIKNIDLNSFENELVQKYRKNSISANQEAECLRLRRTKAYQLYIKGESEIISLQDFYQFTRVNEYFQEKARERRFAIITNAVIDDKDLTELWSFLKERFIKEVK